MDVHFIDSKCQIYSLYNTTATLEGMLHTLIAK